MLQHFAFDPSKSITALEQDSTIIAGIEMSEFYWARQRGKRVVLFWVLAVLVLTGAAAAGAWTVGANLPGLL